MRIKIILVSVALILLTSGFFGLDYIIANKGNCHDLTLSIDRAIPLSPGWIWVYLLYYPMCFLPLAFPGVLKENRLFAAVSAGMLCQFLIAWPTFYFFPTHLNHTWVAPTMPNGLALRGLYLVDPGYNDFPCLHAANSFYVAFLSRMFLPAWLSLSLLLVAMLIAASTLFIKQHFFLDIPSGLLIGYLGFLLAKAMIKKPWAMPALAREESVADPVVAQSRHIRVRQGMTVLEHRHTDLGLRATGRS